MIAHCRSSFQKFEYVFIYLSVSYQVNLQGTVGFNIIGSLLFFKLTMSKATEGSRSFISVLFLSCSLCTPFPLLRRAYWKEQ